MIRKSKIVLALTLVLTLSLSLSPPISLATDPSPSPNLSDATQAAITKIFIVPVCINVPEFDFKFIVTPKSINDDETLIPEMPKIGTNNEVTISYPGSSVIKPCECVDNNFCENRDDVDHYYLQSDPLFPTDGPNAIGWKKAGIYIYEIEEHRPSPYTPQGEVRYFSTAKYSLKVYVKANAQGNGFEITNIAAYKIKEDRAFEKTVNVKIDPSPGDGTTTFSQMRFTNGYTKQNGGDGTDPLTPSKQTLVVEKKVTGVYANNNTNYFKFTINFTRHSLAPLSVYWYRAYILGVDGEPLKTLAANGVTENVHEDVNGYAYTLITTDDNHSSRTFYLKPGEKFVVTNAYVGTSYTITEHGTPKYKATAEVTSAGVKVNEVTGELGNQIKIPGGESPPILWVGDIGENKALFTNEYVVAPDTGLDISDLPFYGMLILALAGLVTFVVIKTRSRKNKEVYHD